jgi:hypothetical protein
MVGVYSAAGWRIATSTAEVCCGGDEERDKKTENLNPSDELKSQESL